MSAEPVAVPPAQETRVSLEFLEDERRYRLLFGHPQSVCHTDHRFGVTRRIAVFHPGQRFALEQWDGKIVLSRSRQPVARTQRWRILVLEAGTSDAHGSHVPGVEPGASILMQADRTKSCELLKAWLLELAGTCDPTELPREFFLARDLRLSALARDRRFQSFDAGAQHRGL